MIDFLKNERLTGLIAEVGLIVLTCGAPLALGGVHRPTILAASLLGCVTLAAVWLYRRPTKRGLRIPLFGLALVGLTFYTALQLVPLPLRVLGLIAPATREVLEVSLKGAGIALGWHPLSLDPGATLFEVLKVGTCALAFIVAHNLFYRSHRRDRLLLALVCTGVIITLLGFLGAVVAPGQPLMLYQPQIGAATGLIITSFVNPNHGSAFLMLCSLVAISLAVSAQDIQHRVLLGLSGVLLGSGVFLTLSRGGILALALALGIFAGLLIWTQRGNRGGKQAALVSAGLALILGLSGWLAFDAIVAEFMAEVPKDALSLGKIALWPSGLAMILANPWVGVGRGAFMTAFTRYLDAAPEKNATYSHLENQFLHLPAELGLIVGGGMILLAAICLMLWIRKGKRDPQSMALAAGLAALAVHNLVDFNLEMLGLALPAAVLAGLLSGGYRESEIAERAPSSSKHRNGEHRTDKHRTNEHRTDEHRTSQHRRKTVSRSKIGRGKIHLKTALITTLGLLVLTLWAWAADPPTSDESLQAIANAMQDQAPLEKVRASVQQAVALHPADYLPHLSMSRRTLADKRPETLAWLNRALYLFPRSPDIHLDTARALLAFGRRRQAILEYHLALENKAPSYQVLQPALALCKDVADVNRLLLAKPQLHAEAVTALLNGHRLDLAGEIVSSSRQRWTGNIDLARVEIDVLLATQHIKQANAAAQRLARLYPRPETYLTWSKTADQKEAVRILAAAQHKFPKDRTVVMALVQAYLQTKQYLPARKLAEEIMKDSRTPDELAQSHDLLAAVYSADGRIHRAQYEAEQALKIRKGL